MVLAVLRRLTPDPADRRALGMLAVGVVLVTCGVLWAAWLLGAAVAVYHLMAG